MSEAQVVGSDAKRDCQVTVTPAPSLEIEIKASNQRLLEPGIRAVVEKTASALGVSKAKIAIADRGALDYVISGRVEAALRLTFPELTSAILRSIPREASERHRIRRSRLYAPGNNPRLLIGLELHGADCVLVDLEDSVPLGEKRATRILVKYLLTAIKFPEVWVRINPLDTYGRDDLAEILRGRPHGICLPKAESSADVISLSKEIEELESSYGIGNRTTYIMPIIETARGVLHSEEIASADQRVVIIAFGAEDFTRDMGARRTEESLLFARSMIVTAAKTAEIQASDTVYSNLDDEKGLIAEAKQARNLGFDGKGVINPRQIEPIHTVFSPTEQEIEEARQIVAAAEEAEEHGLGAIAIEGKMIDKPVLARAQQTLKLAALVNKGGS
jgi:citrate lyase subunit beta/citryl-CoA lyase